MGCLSTVSIRPDCARAAIRATYACRRCASPVLPAHERGGPTVRGMDRQMEASNFQGAFWTTNLDSVCGTFRLTLSILWHRDCEQSLQGLRSVLLPKNWQITQDNKREPSIWHVNDDEPIIGNPTGDAEELEVKRR
jgi:hypothetical protein